MKITVIGSLNIDTTLVCDRLPQKGETLMATDLYNSFGGKGANQAIAAARLGGEVKMVGCVGTDSKGEDYRQQLLKDQIDISLLGRVQTETGTAMISVSQQGNNTILVYPGANFCVTPEYIRQCWDALSQSDIFVLQCEIPMETIEYIVEKATEAQIPVLLNPAPFTPLSDQVLSKLTYLTPNETELGLLCPNQSLEQGIETLLAKGVKNVIVTLGEKGALWADKQEVVKGEPFTVEAIDTTAAGDCFNGAFVVALSQFHSKEEILRFANKAAAHSTLKKGAVTSLPTLMELQNK